MENNVVDKFKVSGNEAFKKGELDKALECYRKAIETEEVLNKDFSKLAILYSNSAQVYLKQNKYDQAVSAASASLEHDPGFKKSLLRRGVSHVELKKDAEASNDLRSFLRMEPNNQEAISYLRRILPYVKLSHALRKVFIGHYLRRALIKCPLMLSKFDSYPLLAKYLLQSMVISLASAQVIKDLLKNGRISLIDSTRYSFVFPPWFILKRMRVDISHNILWSFVSKSMLKVIIQVARPILSLELDESLSLLELYSLCEFDKVYCSFNFLGGNIEPSLTPIKQFNRVSKVLTTLAYFDEIPSLPMPKLNFLAIFPTHKVSSKFINDWAKFKWPIKHLNFRSAVPDLTSFANFKGVVSHDLTDLRMDSGFLDSHNWKINVFPNLIERLTILKRCFPNLKNLTAGFILKCNNGNSPSSSNFLKSHLKFLTTMIDAKKIDWCDKPKVCAKLFLRGETNSNILKIMKFIEKTVNECRKEMKELTSIRFNGPSTTKLHIVGGVCSYARIEMEANGVWFDVSFSTM